MYLNVVCMKCGKTIPFTSKVPYSVDKVVDGWNLITDESNGQIISIRGSEIASVCSQDTSKVGYKKPNYRNNSGNRNKGNKKPFKVEVTES